MKIKITYIILSFLVLLAGCTKHSNLDTGSEAMPTSYIFFSQSLDTKATLVESGAAMGSFAIVGYKYDKSKAWDNTTAADRQAVFYDYVNNTPLSVYDETVTINGEGICSYEPLQGWSNTKKYSFFAYYPINNTNVVLSNTDNGGIPTITYTMDVSSNAAFKASMVDLMTAPCHKDLYGYSSIGENPTTEDINFAFSHRLSALAVNVKNSSTCGITLNTITLNISGIKYNSIIIPLYGTTATSTGPNEKFSKSLGLSIASSEANVTSTGVELSDKLLFIPQTEAMEIAVVVNYTRSATNYTSFTETLTLSAGSTALIEGKKYQVSLNFNETSVTISGSPVPTGWADTYEITDTFN